MFCLFAAMALVLTSCGGSSVDKILNTVPKDSEATIAFDLKSINSKVSADGENLADLIKSAFGDQMDSTAKFFLGEDSPLDFDSPVVLFAFKNGPVLTFYVKDAASFRSAMEKECNLSMLESKGIWASSGRPQVFMADKQVWMRLEGSNLEVSDISRFADLSKDKSILALDAADKVFSDGGDISMLVNLSSVGLYDRDFAQFMAALQLAFDNPSYIGANVSFEKSKALAEATILDSKGKVSKMSVDLGKIDIGKLKKFGGSGNLFGAIAIDPDNLKQAVGQAGAMGMPPAVSRILESLSGNIAFAGDALSFSGYGVSPQFTVSVGFKNESAAGSCLSFLNSDLPSGVSLRTDGKDLIATSGQPSGVSIKEVADDFSGASFGMAVVTSAFSDPKISMISKFIPGAYFVVKPKSGGLQLELVVKTEEGKNSLTTFFKLAKLASTMN